MDDTQLLEITKRLDEIVVLLKNSSRPVSVARRVVDGIATGVGILGIISVIDILKVWIGG